MSRSRTAFLSGTITDNPLTNVATTLNSAGLANLPAIASPDIAVLVLDPTGSAGAPEVVYVTAHTGAATSATISRAAEGSSARQHASGISWVHGPTLYDFKGWRLEGSNTSEQTMTSATPADLVTISGLLIPVTQAVRITGTFRKSAAADVAYFGLKINATTVCEASVSTYVATAAATNEAQSGVFEIIIGPRAANYLRSIISRWTIGGATARSTGTGPLLYTADIPNATITDVIIRAGNGAGAMTIGIKNVLVEVMDS